jgi:hypothetical protein
VLVHAEDVDRHFEHAKRSGARIVHPPTNMRKNRDFILNSS